jgi:hypothetical protein
MIGPAEDALPRFNLRSAATALAAAGALVVTLSCTSSGDGGVTGTNNYLNRGVTLEPIPGSPSPLTSVSLVETAGDATTSCIGIKVLRVTDVFAAAFSVTYDPAILRYTGFDASTSFLGTTAEMLPPQVDAITTPGRIVVGLTRNSAVTTVEIDGTGYLLDLCFEVVRPGEFDMNFVGNLALLKLDGTPVVTLTGSDWIGMHVVVRE